MPVEPAEGFPFIYSQQYLLSIYYATGNCLQSTDRLMRAKDMIRDDYTMSMDAHRRE